MSIIPNNNPSVCPFDCNIHGEVDDANYNEIGTELIEKYYCASCDAEWEVKYVVEVLTITNTGREE